MPSDSAIVITSIFAPNHAMRRIAEGAARRGHEFIVVGDTKSPADFHLPGCRFLSMDDQLALDLKFPRACPVRHYARKNVGYLAAIAAGARIILETDDDNIPLDSFFSASERVRKAPTLSAGGWVNVYHYFTDELVWPRGLPLDAIRNELPPLSSLPEREMTCPIQQGLANDNPDVDALYRLLLPLPIRFAPDREIVLAEGSWCPFNSQNTVWWPEAYPLLYLPAHCSFRMTDIWRSFVAQRICWANGWSLLFRSPTVYQDRNEHNLMRDFEDEVPGYLNNRKIAQRLEDLDIAPGKEHIADNLLACYRALVVDRIVGPNELSLLTAWLEDLEQLDSATR